MDGVKSHKLILEKDLKQLQARVASLQAARVAQPNTVTHRQHVDTGVSVRSLISCAHYMIVNLIGTFLNFVNSFDGLTPTLKRLTPQGLLLW